MIVDLLCAVVVILILVGLLVWMLLDEGGGRED